MMDLFFNELSVSGLSESTIPDCIIKFASLVREAREQGFQNVRFETDLRRIQLSEGLSFAQYCERYARNQEVKALFSLQVYPYIQETEEDTFLESDFYVSLNDGTKVSISGLAAASIYNSCGVGFDTSQWNNLVYSITIEKGEEVEEKTVLCLSRQEHFEDVAFIGWAEDFLPEPNLIKSEAIPMDKKIHLSDHHGKAELQAFSKRIVMSPYVEEVVNSIDRDSYDKAFVSSLHDGNMIDIRLVNKGGFGLTVKTTARNMRQLKAIARLLEKKYS